MTRCILGLALVLHVGGVGQATAGVVTYAHSLDLNAGQGQCSTSPYFHSYNNPQQQFTGQLKLVSDASLTDLLWYHVDFIRSFDAARSFITRLFADVGVVPANNLFFEGTVTASVFNTGLKSSDDGDDIFRFSAGLESFADLNAGTDYWLYPGIER
jgi:hypothetical protein